jgi:hypothetical protein
MALPYAMGKHTCRIAQGKTFSHVLADKLCCRADLVQQEVARFVDSAAAVVDAAAIGGCYQYVDWSFHGMLAQTIHISNTCALHAGTCTIAMISAACGARPCESWTRQLVNMFLCSSTAMMPWMLQLLAWRCARWHLTACCSSFYVHAALHAALHTALHTALHAALHTALHAALHTALRAALHAILHVALQPCRNEQVDVCPRHSGQDRKQCCCRRCRSPSTTAEAAPLASSGAVQTDPQPLDLEPWQSA